MYFKYQNYLANRQTSATSLMANYLCFYNFRYHYRNTIIIYYHLLYLHARNVQFYFFASSQNMNDFCMSDVHVCF